MNLYKKHLINEGTTIRDALCVLNELAKDRFIFVVDKNDKLIGSLTDGDVRRALIQGVNLETKVDDIIQNHPKFIRKDSQDIKEIIEFRENDIGIIPILDEHDHIVNIINFRKLRSYLPLDVVIMAGGKGSRLRPLTENVPKPLLKIGDKPIIEQNIDRLSSYGISNFWISINYLGEQIENYFKNGKNKDINIDYVKEDEPLGTIGAVSKIDEFVHNTVLVTNSDILTNLDYEDFYLNFLESNADMAVMTIAFKVDIPYAVMEINNGNINAFREKPTYTYYSNGGIYLIKKELLGIIPKNRFYNTTDLLEELILRDKKVISYPFAGYWLDIGKHEDFEKAQIDIKKIKF